MVHGKAIWLYSLQLYGAQLESTLSEKVKYSQTPELRLQLCPNNMSVSIIPVSVFNSLVEVIHLLFADY